MAGEILDWMMPYVTPRPRGQSPEGRAAVFQFLRDGVPPTPPDKPVPVELAKLTSDFVNMQVLNPLQGDQLARAQEMLRRQYVANNLKYPFDEQGKS